jgi:metal-responsive CopG/Arc/MetJ family transcriptional regulator
MAVLTVNDNLLREIDDSAQLEKVSREEFIQRAISGYLRTQTMERLRAEGCTPQVMKMAKKYLTDEDFIQFMDEIVKEVRVEKRDRKS